MTTAPKLMNIATTSSFEMLSLMRKYANIEAQNGVVFVRVYWTVIGTSVFPTMNTTIRSQP